MVREEAVDGGPSVRPVLFCLAETINHQEEWGCGKLTQGVEASKGKENSLDEGL